jgi:hypothetical protein
MQTGQCGGKRDRQLSAQSHAAIHKSPELLSSTKTQRWSRGMRALPTAALFSRADARAAGWSDAALTRAVRSGRVLRVRRDQFTAIENRDDACITAQAAARACNGSVVSHRSAALLHGLPLLRPASRPDLTVAPSGTGDVSGALLHRARLRPEDVTQVAGVSVTSVARTLVDLGRSLPTAGAVVPIDAALHRGAVTFDGLDDVVLMCWNWPGIRRAMRALRYVDARSESPLESVSRLILRWLKLPNPDLQVSLCDDLGAFIGRADFYWDEYGVVGEADGRAKYDTRDVLLHEKRRQEALEASGLIVVRWDWADAVRRPNRLARRLMAAFDRGRGLDRSRFPRRWSVWAA